MSVTRRNLIAIPALVIASVLFVATSYYEPVQRSVSTSSAVTLDDEGVLDFVAVVTLPELAEPGSRPPLEREELWVRNEEARRSTDVLRVDVAGVEPVPLRDGLTVRLDFDESCPEAGECVIEVPLRLEGRRNRDDQVQVGVTITQSEFAADADEEVLDTDAEPRVGFEDLVIEVDIVLAE